MSGYGIARPINAQPRTYENVDLGHQANPGNMREHWVLTEFNEQRFPLRMVFVLDQYTLIESSGRSIWKLAALIHCEGYGIRSAEPGSVRWTFDLCRSEMGTERHQQFQLHRCSTYSVVDHGPPLLRPRTTAPVQIKRRLRDPDAEPDYEAEALKMAWKKTEPQLEPSRLEALRQRLIRNRESKSGQRRDFPEVE